ncbi:hypothetical protein DTO166G4_5209 [Paecilomyces variotii]|nr:hypothetical protein DTO166G4_5209 [Paecilomyces variotii]KAJ9227952.1 hypothetical protein DTO166G5_8975 [Paecilomyces variotii]KAJ9259660.1 hypothetical protein DTO195F2_4781 [Paecilomyces variotii]KAJ9305402.1 hypothetical protein DTO217A2_5042 [Paecilomyces variotii]KAJ9370867.1 hypothetical protein DTO282E5_4396 [Paecilomyces variotii]
MGRAGRRLYAGQPQRRQIPSAPFLDPERQQEKSPLPSAASRLGTTGEHRLHRPFAFAIRRPNSPVLVTVTFLPYIWHPRRRCPPGYAERTIQKDRLFRSYLQLHRRGPCFGIPGTFPVYPVSLAAHSFSYLFLGLLCVSFSFILFKSST